MLLAKAGHNPGRVSVVIPAYNREAYIEQAVRSVLDQTYRDAEVLVVDDGSTDATRAVLTRFGDAIRVLEHPGGVNKGQSAAINLGLAEVTGEYVAVLDSDDYWLPRKLALQVARLERDPAIGLVYCNGHGVDPDGKPLYRVYGPAHQEQSDPARVLLDCYFFVPTNALVRASVMQVVGGFDESLRAAQDHDMAIRIAEVTRLAYLDEDVFCYRRHPDSISQKGARRRWHNGFRILENARRRYPYSPATVRKRRAVLNFRLFQCCLGERDYLGALRHATLAGVLDPVRSVRVLVGRERVTAPN